MGRGGWAVVERCWMEGMRAVVRGKLFSFDGCVVLLPLVDMVKLLESAGFYN